MTIKLIRFVKHDELQNEDSLVQLYHNFITSFESKYAHGDKQNNAIQTTTTKTIIIIPDHMHRINPYGLVEICCVVASHIADKAEANKFLAKLQEKVKVCDEAVWFCRVLQGQNSLEHLQDLPATKAIIEDLKEVLEESGNVTPVHGKYFLLASQYYRRVGQYSDYYRCGLQFLGCSLDVYPKEEWPQQAFFLGLAALMGDGIYNIGELVSNKSRMIYAVIFFSMDNYKLFLFCLDSSLIPFSNRWTKQKMPGSSNCCMPSITATLHATKRCAPPGRRFPIWPLRSRNCARKSHCCA